MPKTLAWFSLGDPAFPPNLVQYLGDKTPKRLGALGNLDILQNKVMALVCSVKCPGNLILKTYDFAQGVA